MKGRNLTFRFLRAKLKIRYQTIVRHNNLVQRHFVETRHISTNYIFRCNAGLARQRGLEVGLTTLVL